MGVVVMLAAAIGANATTIYWTGDSAAGANWNSISSGDSNWATFNGTSYVEYGLAPATAANLDVVFYAPGASRLTTGVLSANLGVNSFKFSGTSTSDVTIGTGGTLTIGAGGLTVESGAGALLLPRMAASVDQTWAINSGKSVSFGLFDFPTVTGVNAVRLSSGTLTTTSTGTGNLVIQNGATWKRSGGDVTKVVLKLEAGSTLDAAGSTGLSIGALNGDGGTFINFAAGSKVDLTSEAGGTSATYTGVISNAFTDLNVTGRLLSSGTMTQILGAKNSYTGNTFIAANTAGKNVTLQLINVNDVLPTTTVLSFGVTNPATVTTGKLILGNATKAVDQTVAGLTNATSTTPANAVYSVVGGNANSISTLTVSPDATTDYTFSGRIGGDAAGENNVALVKSGAKKLTLSGINTYAGNTIVNAGTLELADNGGLRFVIGASGVNNKIAGTGTLNLNGDFTFDLTGAGQTVGDSWSIVANDTLAATYGSTFTVVGFTEASSTLWTQSIDSSKYYRFSESTGLLSVAAVPEPASLGLLMLALPLLSRKRRSSASV